MRKQHMHCPYSRTQINFARDLQDRLGILALLSLSAPFRICKLQIPLARRETDPVSGHHIFNNLQAHRATITFRKVPTARRSRQLPRLGLSEGTGKSSAAWGRENLADGHFLRRLKRLGRNDRGINLCQTQSPTAGPMDCNRS
jgi:hypothetical protein